MRTPVASRLPELSGPPRPGTRDRMARTGPGPALSLSLSVVPECSALAAQSQVCGAVANAAQSQMQRSRSCGAELWAVKYAVRPKWRANPSRRRGVLMLLSNVRRIAPAHADAGQFRELSRGAQYAAMRVQARLGSATDSHIKPSETRYLVASFIVFQQLASSESKLHPDPSPGARLFASPRHLSLQYLTAAQVASSFHRALRFIGRLHC